MKKIISLIVLMSFIVNIYAQDASYTYRPLAIEGCHVEYSALKQDDKSYIVVSVKSDEGICFINEPIMMLRTANNEVIKLKGINIGNRHESSFGAVIGYVLISENNSVSMAQFELNGEQIEMLGLGIKKVRLTTTPFIHEREFSKDKIGKKLYNAFQRQNDTEF